MTSGADGVARAGDDLDGRVPVSVYTTQSFTADPAYYGIRRAPYSVNHAINSLSFRHMANGEALPTRYPFHASVTTPRSTTPARSGRGAVGGLRRAPEAGTSFDDVRSKMAQVRRRRPRARRRPRRRRWRCATRSCRAPPRPRRSRFMLAAFARRGSAAARSHRRLTSVDFIGLSSRRSSPARWRSSSRRSRTIATTTEIFDSGEKVHVRVKLANEGHAPLTGLDIYATTNDLHRAHRSSRR